MLSHTHPHHQMALEYFMPTGPLAVLPFVSEKNKHHSALVWSTTPDAAADLMIMTEQTFCAWLKKYVGEWLGDITLASARQAWPLNELKAEKSFKARLVLLGEAAHAMHPIAGQGYNLTMRNLGALKKIWRDIKHTGGDVGAHCALAGYHRARQFDTWRMMTAMDGLVKGFSNNLPGFSLLRQLGLSVVDLSPSLKEKFANQAMGTEISASSRKSIKIV
ncbi:MAG: hypothetical protein EB121_04970 [Alphaproteobacteria bacterium]|nr:hypothetical protein [Alphaproteobacteria bacterium]